MPRLAIVSATLDYPRMEGCFRSWVEMATGTLEIYLVAQGHTERDWECFAHIGGTKVYGYHHRQILGVVPAFALGVQRALQDGAEIIACFHDDLLIEQEGWDQQVINLFRACPRAGLCGFGGATGLGHDQLYDVPYHPMSLARQHFGSNMRDAELHGVRWEAAQPVACLDGFSQIGTCAFWQGRPQHRGEDPAGNTINNLFAQMQHLGVIHHFYDGMLGCFAKRLGYQVWYLPIACHHSGGATAVGDKRYQKWANAQPITRDSRGHMAGGDQGFWLKAHQVGYDEFKDVLPIRT